MKFQRIASRLKQHILFSMIKLLPCELETRTRISQATTICVYVLDYFILLLIINIPQSYFQLTQSFLVALILNIARAVVNIIFLSLKIRLFLIIQRVLVICTIILANHAYCSIFACLIVLDILSCIKFGFSIQQKALFFDSRLFVKYATLKQIVINCFPILTTYFAQQKLGIYQYFAVCCVLILIDNAQILYNQKFYKTLNTANIYCLLCVVMPYISPYPNDGRINYQNMYILGGNFIIFCAYLYNCSTNYQLIYKFNRSSHKFDQRQILNYLICLEQLIKSNNQYEMHRFIIFHLHHCQQIGCYIRFQQKIEEKNKLKMQTLQYFKRQILVSQFSKHKQLEFYFMYNCIDVNKHKFTPKTFSQLFFYYRVSNNLKNQMFNNIYFKKTLQNANIEDQQIENDIKSLLLLSKQFWNQLIYSQINYQKVTKKGFQIMSTLKNIQLYSKNCIISQKSQYLIKNVFQFIFNKQNPVKHQSQSKITSLCEALPTLMVSAQKQNFLQIINVNTQLSKAAGFTKQQFLSLTADALWDQQIREQHIFLAQKRARCNSCTQGQIIRSYAFIKNKQNYAVIVDAVVYYSDDVQGKKWCIVMYPYLQKQAILILNSKRQIIGISQKSVQFGFNLQIQGLSMRQQLFQQCLNSPRSIDISRAFCQNQQKQIYFLNCHAKFQSKIYFQGRPFYYVFTLSKKKKNIQQNSIKSQKKNNTRQTRRSISNLLKDNRNIINFQFDYVKKQNIFLGGYFDEYLENHIDQQKQEGINFQRANSQISSSCPVTEDIIQMRLWKHKLDFLQNLNNTVPNFQSFPLPRFASQQDIQLRMKKNINDRKNFVKKQVKHIKIYIFALIILVLTLLSYLIARFLHQRLSQQYSLSYQTLSSKQIFNLACLNTIIIKNQYQSIDLSAQLKSKINEIDSIYKFIQTQQLQLNSDVTKISNDQHSLIKLDQSFRIIIQRAFTSNFTKQNEVYTFFLDNLVLPWLQIRQNNMQINKKQTLKTSTEYYIATAITWLCIILLFIGSVRIINNNYEFGKRVCLIFTSLDHQFILNYICKVKSFAKFMDMNQSSLIQQNLLIQQNKINDNCTTKKYLTKRRNNSLVLILIICSLVCFGLYFTIAFSCQTVIQHARNSQIQVMYQSTTLLVIFKMLWIQINTDVQRNHKIIQIQKTLVQNERTRQHPIQVLSTFQDYLNSNLKIMAIQLSSGNICNLLPNCSVSLTNKNNKLLISEYLFRVHKSINKYELVEQFRKSREAQWMLNLDDQYTNTIYQFLITKINELFILLQQKQLQTQLINTLILILGFGLFFVWGWHLKQKYVKLSQLQELLKCVPFISLQNNNKYVQYIQLTYQKQR